MHVHIVMHESFEAPAAIELWARSKAHTMSYTRLYRGDVFPQDSSFDVLVVMGGPQSPATTTKECPYFDAKREIDFIEKAIHAQKRVFGVCLGAQLIGEALGAHVAHSPQREIGVFPLTLTDDGKRDPIVGKFPATFNVGHWHGDMPGLTPQSVVLAFSEGCPRQIVRYSEKVYGFQCHLEFTSEAVEGMISNNAHELEQYRGMTFIETAGALRAHDYGEMNALLFMFLDQLTEH